VRRRCARASGQIRADREAAPPGDLAHLVAHDERWGEEQAYLLAQLTAVTDLATWRLLRRELGLSPDETTAAIRELADACLP
jgi:hypothetical protein